MTCSKKCSSNCVGSEFAINNTCDFFGNCLFGCKTPYTGPKCEEQECPFNRCRSCGYNYAGHLECKSCEAGKIFKSVV